MNTPTWTLNPTTRPDPLTTHTRSRRPGDCGHPLTSDYSIAGLTTQRCVECHHIGIRHDHTGPTGSLFAIPRYADTPPPT